MGTIHLCLEVNCNYTELYSRMNPDLAYQQALGSLFDSQYHEYYKLLQFLYAHPSCHLSISISGRHLDWFARNHREFLLVLSELIGRKQVEILGGAYYNPLLPTILPVDRVGQIELYTTALRRHTGKRPRGMVVPNNAWDPSLVSCLKNCAMDFVMMDSRLIPQGTNTFLPYIVQEQGKIIYVLGQNQQHSPFEVSCTDGGLEKDHLVSPKEYLSYLEKQVFDSCPEAEHPLVCLSLSLKQMNHLLESQWLQQLDSIINQEQVSSVFQWNLPSRYIKTTQHYQRTYIPAGVLLPEHAPQSQELKDGRDSILTPYDYLLQNTGTYLLYSKMMYLSILVSQSRGDKNRRKIVRDLLMESQSGESYVVHATKSSFSSQKHAYRSLLHAEKIVREYIGFFDSVTSYDYDADGIREYICQFQPYNAYIQRRGGSIFEFDVFQTYRNYVGRGEEGFGLFLDYFLDDFSSDRNDVFARQLYKERAFDGKRKNIELGARGTVGPANQPVSLKKNYVVSPDGILVQYIIKNESLEPLQQVFAVDSHIYLDAAGSHKLDTELICGQEEELQVFHSQLPEGKGRDVSQVRFSDQEVSFVFVLNEQAHLQMEAEQGKLLVSLCWQLEIPPEREVEKNISFVVLPRKTTKRL
ncbi:MAG: hypothetical protein J6R96_07440 [Spirochaetaceae bacterium]|nr:hypothetical protein [Spirochaetaceae bacterium]